MVIGDKRIECLRAVRVCHTDEKQTHRPFSKLCLANLESTASDFKNRTPMNVLNHLHVYVHVNGV